jgi:hypothetical protein
VTRDQQLETAIHELTVLQAVCGQYGDLETARIAMEAVRALHKRRTPKQVETMEQERGLRASS